MVQSIGLGSNPRGRVVLYKNASSPETVSFVSSDVISLGGNRAAFIVVLTREGDVFVKLFQQSMLAEAVWASAMKTAACPFATAIAVSVPHYTSAYRRMHVLAADYTLKLPETVFLES